MTTRKLLSILMLGMVGSSAFAIEPPVKPTSAGDAAEFVVGNKYYLRNVEAGQYLTGGNSWATQMSLTKDGLLDENNQAIIVMGVDSTAQMNTATVPGVALQLQGSFTFDGVTPGGSPQNDRTMTNTFIFRESETTGFVDHGTQAHGYIWDIEQVPGTNKYLLKTPAEDPDFGATGTVAGVYKDAEGTEVTWAAADEEGFGAEWEFIPADEYQALLKIYDARVSFYDAFNKATAKAEKLGLTVDFSAEEAVYNNESATAEEIKAAEEALKAKIDEASQPKGDVSYTDITEGVINNPDGYTNNAEGWTVDGFKDQAGWGRASIAPDASAKCTEGFREDFDVNQTIKGLEAGTYKVTVQGFHRQGAWDEAGAIKSVAIDKTTFYANDEEVALKSLYTEDPIFDQTGGYANNMTQAGQMFDADPENYINEVLVTIAEGEDLKIGIKNTDATNNNWTIWANFKIAKQDVQDVPTEPEATAEDLTLDLFHVYASDAADAEQTGESTTATLKLGELTDCPYGNTNVNGLEYADLADYDQLILTVAEDTPRLFFNATAEDSNNRVNVLTANGTNDPYIISAEDGVYVIDLAKIKEETGKVHLNGIKAGAWNTTTNVTSIQLKKATDEPDQPVVDQAVEDVKAQIADLGAAELTDEYKVKLDAARAAYEDLTEEQKAGVDNLADLEKAESDYKALEEAAQPEPEPVNTDKYVPDQVFASVADMDGQILAISNNGKYFYASGAQNLGFDNGEAAFADGIQAYNWQIVPVDGAEGQYYIKAVKPNGDVYSFWGNNNINYLNSQAEDGWCCFILGTNGDNGQVNGQDIDNGAVWELEYNEEAQGFAIKNVGTGKYLSASTGSANNAEPTYFTFSTLKENTPDEPAPVVDEAVDNAESLIDAIGDVEYTDDCKAKIDAARAAYNELTDAQKAKVENIATLEAAEEAYKALEEEANPDDPTPVEPELEEGLTEIAQNQGKDLDTFTRTDFVEGDDYNTYTAHGDLNIAFKMVNLDVEGCDYVVVKFAEPVAAGWKLAFWNNQDLVDVPEGATEYKYVFDEDPKCDVANGVLPQICMMTFFGAPSQLDAKVAGIYKHTADTATGIDETESKTTVKNGVYMENGKIVIVKDGKKFTTGGVEIK